MGHDTEIDEWDFDKLAKEVMTNPDARCAAIENKMRRELAVAFEAARLEKGLSIRKLANQLGTPISQVQRLLHKEVGGSLSLLTMVKAADALGLVLQFNIGEKKTCATSEHASTNYSQPTQT